MDLNEIKNNKPQRPVMFYYVIALAVLLLLNFALVPWLSEKSIQETTYSEFLNQLEAGNVTKVEVQTDEYSIYYVVEQNGKEIVCKTGQMNDPDLVERLRNSKAQFAQVVPKQASPILSFILSWIDRKSVV